MRCCAAQIIINIRSYPTKTDLVIVTNKPDNLANWRDSCAAVDGLPFEVSSSVTSGPRKSFRRCAPTKLAREFLQE